MPELTFIVQTKERSSAQEQTRSLSQVRYHAAKATQRRRYAETAAAAKNTRRTAGATIDAQRSLAAELGRRPILAYKGNSDPFAASCGVDVTPRISEVLNYIVDVYLPTTYPSGKSWIREHSTELFFRDQTRIILSSPIASCSMLPFLSILAMAAAGGQRRSESLAIQLLIMKKTREAIGGATSDHEQLLFQIKALFSSAVAEQSWSAARSHGAILNTLLQQLVERPGWAATRQKFIINLLFFTLNMTQMTLRKSVVDVGIWFDQCLQETSEPVLNYLEPLHEWFENRLDTAIGDEHLRRIYRDLYETIWLWYRQDQPAPDITQYGLNQFCRMQHNALSCRLINLFAGFKGELKPGSAALAPEIEAFLVSQAVLALALPAFMATFVYSPSVGSQYIWKRYPVLLGELRALLSRKPQSPGDAACSIYQNVLLWAYWVGATWEQADPGLTAGSTSAWFTVRFAELCQELGLARWAQVEQVLDGFAIIKFARPPGSQWVDAILECAV